MKPPSIPSLHPVSCIFSRAPPIGSTTSGFYYLFSFSDIGLSFFQISLFPPPRRLLPLTPSLQLRHFLFFYFFALLYCGTRLYIHQWYYAATTDRAKELRQQQQGFSHDNPQKKSAHGQTSNTPTNGGSGGGSAGRRSWCHANESTAKTTQQTSNSQPTIPLARETGLAFSFHPHPCCVVVVVF